MADEDWEEDTYDQPQQSYNNNQQSRSYNQKSYHSDHKKSYNNDNYKSRQEYHTARPVHNDEYDQNQNETTEEVMVISNDKVKFVVGRGGSKIKEIQSTNNVRLQIDSVPNEEGMTNITISGSANDILLAKSTIEGIVKYVPTPRNNEVHNSNRYDNMNHTRNDYVPSQRFSNSNYSRQTEMPLKNDDNYKPIDWDSVNQFHEKAQKERWAHCVPILKDFYTEDENVRNMSPEDVAEFRAANNNIAVSQFLDEGETESVSIPNPVSTFDQCFAEYPDLLEELKRNGFVHPSPIQSQAWPILLQGNDLIGIAQTGTGKTLAFLLPAMIHIEKQPVPRNERNGPNVLVLAPTRELALQIQKEVGKYNFRGIKAVCFYGGGDRKAQIDIFKQGVEIVIATPGRLNDLISAKIFDVTSITYLVLDEADRMLDMGFEPQIRKFLCDIRPDRQTVMTSATWPSSVQRLAKSFLVNPLQVNIGSLDLTAVHSVVQIIEIMDVDSKFDRIFNFIKDMTESDKVIIFCGKKSRANDLSSELLLRNISCQVIHGDREQSDREQALADIKSGYTSILVATDVASRGIDIEDVSHVINFDFPRNIEEYVHRVGRTGRAGRTGISLSFFTREDWGSASPLMKILEEANQHIPDELYAMADRFQAMKLKQSDEKARFGVGSRGNRGNFSDQNYRRY